MKKYKIGIFGSAVSESKAKSAAEELGKSLATKNIILVTGACEGVPNNVLKSVKKLNPVIEAWGFSAFDNKENQTKMSPGADISLYSKIFYIPQTFEYIDNIPICRKYRNVLSTSSTDGAIIISGRWGTLNEFTNLVDMGKVIGVLTGTGGIADELEALSKKIFKKTSAVLLFDNDPIKLVDTVIKILCVRSGN